MGGREEGNVYHLFNLGDTERSSFWHKMLPWGNDNFKFLVLEKALDWETRDSSFTVDLATK